MSMDSIKRLHAGPRMSQAVVHGPTIYLAGQVADQAKGKSVGEQTKEILATIDRLLAEAAPLVKPLPEEVPDSRFRYFDDDAAFLEALERSYEWDDLALLLRVVRELKLDPLLLSMPIEDAHLERMGISPLCRAAYSEKLHAFASTHDVPVVDFLDHGNDPEFFADHFGHPSAKGWLYFNRALDDFFHGRPMREGDSSPPDARTLSKSPEPGISRSE